MPMHETDLQRDEILPYFCREEVNGGLGYRETANNIVSTDLFIPSQLAEFVESAAPDVWARLVRRHRGDARELTEALKADVKARILESPNNNAVFLNKNNSISFEGERVPLFIPSGSELSNNVGFRKNIFAAVEEMSHAVVSDGAAIDTVRPDISFFLNGIFIGYLELKSVTNGQNAAVKGRGKVVGDYLGCVRAMAEQSRARPQVLEKNNRIRALYLFEKGIHLTTSDVNETYVLRSPGQFFDEAVKAFVERTATIATLRPDVEKVFKPYPVSSALLTNKGKFIEVTHALYGKKSIEKEILYYNFVQYKYERRGRKKVTHGGHGVLISPRPKQKFGCDKVLTRVREMLAHEAEPDFYRNKLKVELEALLPGNPARVEEILAQRDLYCNNKYVYSLLMQYAAGFGKSNIIGWTALQLKNLRHDGGWAFDKILIVVDRLQLRDQLDTMMQSMNISKAMFTEVKNQAQFVSALSDLKRILVVNIQKFSELRKSLEATHTQLGRMRVAFLIDEIHRSNTGEQGREMINIFEELQDAINGARCGGGAALKKNLIVGFTATPTEKVLARFGEFKSASIIPTWVPFDAYTMREAIDDGYILDPTKHIIAVQKTMRFDLPPEVDPGSDRAITLEKAAVYRNEDRMEELSQFIVNRLVSTVYPRIRGTAKGMLAVSSIPNAINYCQRIRRLFAQKCEEPMYRRYKDAPVSIVYSDNQENESCSSMNDNKTEEKVIQDFRAAKNGLIIVVDKLQTGFDEPKLHTLFLDKEIHDIIAIQTISRVDRTCKYKDECHIVDLSWRNVNVANIKEAFRKYENIVVSGFNPEQEAMRVEVLYRLLGRSEPYVRWFQEYRRRNSEAAFMLQMEDGIRNWIRVQFERSAAAESEAPTGEEFLQVVNAAKELRANVGQYGLAIEALEDVFDIDPKYRAPIFISFWLKYCNIYRDVIRMIVQGGAGPTHPIIDVGDDVPGITVVDDPSEDDEDEGGEGEGGLGDGDFTRHRRNVWDVLMAWNEIEQLSKSEKEKWLAEIGQLFEWLRTQDTFMAVIRDDRFTPEEKLTKYSQLLVGYKFKLMRRPDLVKASLFKKMLDDNAAQFLDIFIEAIPEAEDEGLAFDFRSETEGPEVLREIGEELKYNGWLPVYGFAAACGRFGAEEAVESDGWIDVTSARLGHLTEKMYVVRAKGHSMEPLVADGQYCVFEYREGTFDPNDIVLAQHTPVQDDETEGAFSIKKAVVEKGESEDAETQQNVSIVLQPLNRDPKYGPIVLPDLGEFGNDYKIVGVLKKTL